MVYKLSYQTHGCPSEGALYSRFYGQFGIVDIIGYHVCTAKESFGSKTHHFLNAQFRKLVDDSPVRSPETEQLRCTAMALEGLPLLGTSDKAAGIPTPVGLMETILRSMRVSTPLYSISHCSPSTICFLVVSFTGTLAAEISYTHESQSSGPLSSPRRSACPT
ncbi:hypothetical protein EDB92DRAFT_286137 [Lactarius akahatsu]|uniref:Uncharacterized protein n=1 Tax=Lactarius akahatsu TaxID=416441 RepID=A0AAD4LKQ3_9AGAM|nr:hypothetical protein EDB92DRAFT_286137 [Lactarius akahatsu]